MIFSSASLKVSSLTFSLVFALAVLGSSFGGLLRAPLRTIGIWGPLVLILPIVATGLLAKQERKLKMEMRTRQICSYTMIFGSILMAILLWQYESWLQRKYADSVQPGPLFKEQDNPLLERRGPRGKR